MDSSEICDRPGGRTFSFPSFEITIDKNNIKSGTSIGNVDGDILSFTEIKFTEFTKAVKYCVEQASYFNLALVPVASLYYSFSRIADMLFLNMESTSVFV